MLGHLAPQSITRQQILPYSLNNQYVMGRHKPDLSHFIFANITIFNKIKSVGMPFQFGILPGGDRRKVTRRGPLMALKPQEELLRVSVEVVTRVQFLRRHVDMGSFQIRENSQPTKCPPKGKQSHHTAEALGSLYKQCC
jgi:hypothetical protein